MKRRLSADAMPTVGAVTENNSSSGATNRAVGRLTSKYDPNAIVVNEKKDTETISISGSRMTQTRTSPSTGHLISLNALICGIEFSASAGFAYIPPLLQKIGLSKTATTCLMGIGPFLALCVIPMLGQWSDHCQFRFGRRWPFILAISFLLVCSLYLIPFGGNLGRFIGPEKLGIIFTAVGVVLLDFSCLIGFNPCEALISDAVSDTDVAKTGFMVYSCMLSLGGCIGYLVTATDWSGTLLGGVFKSQEQMAFSVIIFIMIIASSTTLWAAKECPDGRKAKDDPRVSYAVLGPKIVCEAIEDYGYETGSNESLGDETICRNENGKHCILLVTNRSSAGAASTMLPANKDRISSISLEKTTLPILDKGRIPLGCTIWLPLTLFYFCTQKARSVLYRVVILLRQSWHLLIAIPCHIIGTPLRSVKQVSVVPVVLRRLFLADFCGWAALLCYYMFYTDYIAQAVFLGDPNAADGTTLRSLYDAGVRMGSWGLLLHSITACIYAAFLQDVVINLYGMMSAYFIGLGLFGFCMLGIMLTSNIVIINALTATAGIGFAAITTIPNTLITCYHGNKELYFFDDIKKSDDPVANGNLQERGIASDIAVIDTAYILAQIMLSVAMGPLVDLTSNVMVYIVISTVFAFIACYCVSRVVFTATSAQQLHDARI